MRSTKKTDLHEPSLDFSRPAGSGFSFWLFDEDHPVRVWVYDRVCHKWYDYFMFFIIGGCGVVLK